MTLNEPNSQPNEPQDQPQSPNEPVVPQATEDENEIRGSRYYKQQLDELQAKYSHATRYAGIIDRLENDSSLLDVLQRHIAGEMVEAGSIFDDDTQQPSRNSQPQAKPAVDDIEAARQRGAAEAHMQAELKNMFSELASRGAPEYLMDKFLAFANNPTGLNAWDMWAAFMSKENRENPVTAPEEKKQNGPKGLPISAVAGDTDRPDTSKTIKRTSNNTRYVHNPNAIV